MSSQQSSSNNNNQNQYSDYQTEQSFNHHQQQQQTNPYSTQDYYEEYNDEDLPNEIAAALDAHNEQQQNHHEEDDEAVFSDDVQDAFKKYQNEQDELYAQMEECWNYMNEESSTPKPSSSDSFQSSFLNPDANEFKPSWLNTSNDNSSNQSKEAQPKF